jgi:hypothetical protein
MSEFWTLVEQARTDAAGGGDRWPSGSAIGAALVDRLAALPLQRIVEFDRCYTRAVARAHQWTVCAAAFVIWKHLTDDSFSDFKAGLVGLGEETFEQTVTDPDGLAGHPLVQAIAAGQVDQFTLSGESIQSAAPQAYERLTDDADAFWEALDTQPEDTRHDTPAPDDQWSGHGSADDAAQIPQRLPRLHALFGPSTAQGR